MLSKKKRVKKPIVITLCVLLSIAALCFINFIPTFSLKSPGMHELNGKWVNVYYENEESAAKDVFEYADSGTEAIAKKLGFDKKQDVNIFIYDNQSTMQRKKYGFIGPMLGLDWYIGDNMGTNVILTSPANPGNAHSYKEVKEAVLHEVTHAYVSVLNSRVHLWLTEGTALYLSNGAPFYKDYLNGMDIPTFDDTKTRNPIKFENVNGYMFSPTYIEYIDKTYGWDKVLDLIRTEDYEACFGKTQKEIYDEWVNYIVNYYQ